MSAGNGAPFGQGERRENTHLRFLKTAGIMILILIAVTLVLPRHSISVETEEETLEIACISESLFGSRELFRTEVRYEDIGTMECVDTEIRGTFVSGYAGRYVLGAAYDAGIWNEPEYGGDYDLVIREDARKAILITENGGHRILFNFESTDSTINLYSALIEYLER